MLDKLMSSVRSEGANEVPFPKRPAVRNHQCVSLYLRSAKAVVARQVIGVLADVSREEIWQVSREIDHKLLVKHFKSLLQYDLSELQTVLQSHPETRSEEHTSELQSLMRTSYAVFCLKKKK